jgi:DNA polymerase-1
MFNSNNGAVLVLTSTSEAGTEGEKVNIKFELGGDALEQVKASAGVTTDVELPVGPADLARRPIDETAVREVFDRLQFKTLLERVLKIAAAERGGDVADAPSAPAARGIPVVRTMIDEELAKWIATVSANGTAPLGLRIATEGGAVVGFGLASADESAYVPWAPGRPDYVALEDWLGSDAPKYLQGAKAQLKAATASGIGLAGIEFDTTLAAWLLKPGAKPETLESQVYDYLGERLEQSDPNQLVPETEAASPATEAWYILRVAQYLAEKLEPGSRGVLDDIELPLVPVLATMETTGITVNRGILATLTTELGVTAADVAQRAFAEIGREINLGSPKQLQEVLFEQLGMPKTRSNKTGFSTDAASLADLQEQNPHPFLDLLLQHRGQALPIHVYVVSRFRLPSYV